MATTGSAYDDVINQLKAARRAAEEAEADRKKAYAEALEHVRSHASATKIALGKAVEELAKLVTHLGKVEQLVPSAARIGAADFEANTSAVNATISAPAEHLGKTLTQLRQMQESTDKNYMTLYRMYGEEGGTGVGPKA